ncbi:MAG: hypothetical protein AB7P20_07355 [Rhizobiaceae bacterium]
MNATENLSLHPGLRLFSAGVLVVLLVGAGLFVAPELVKPRWPWAVTPFNSRFLGGFYIAEMAGMAALLLWNRWSPARLILIMALVFTLVATIASLLNLEIFNLQRKSTWAWFGAYGLSIVVSAVALWLTRERPAVNNLAVGGPDRLWLQAETMLLVLYGIALLVLPALATSFWPWPIDKFHAQVYSAVFLSGAAGVYLLWSSPAREEMVVLGAAELIFGALAIIGMLMTNAVVNKIVWSSGTIAWVAIFAAMAISGARKLQIGLVSERR